MHCLRLGRAGCFLSNSDEAKHKGTYGERAAFCTSPKQRFSFLMSFSSLKNSFFFLEDFSDVIFNFLFLFLRQWSCNLLPHDWPLRLRAHRRIEFSFYLQLASLVFSENYNPPIKKKKNVEQSIMLAWLSPLLGTKTIKVLSRILLLFSLGWQYDLQLINN